MGNSHLMYYSGAFLIGMGTVLDMDGQHFLAEKTLKDSLPQVSPFEEVGLLINGAMKVEMAANPAPTPQLELKL